MDDLPETPPQTPDQPSERFDSPTLLREPDSPLRDAFFGRDGLRAGWSLLLYALLYQTLVYCAGWIPGLLHAAGSDSAMPGLISPGFLLRNEGASVGVVLLATWLMSVIERRPLGSYGFARVRPLARLAAGAAWGLAMLSLLIVSLKSAGLLIFDGQLLHAAMLWSYAAEWLAAFVLVAIFEETFFRGFLQTTLSRGLTGIFEALEISHSESLGFWTSAVLLSCGFGLVHTTNAGESPIGIFAAIGIGLVFCLSLWRTGSLWWAIGFHAAWDWAESYLYGVSDSGLLARGRLMATHPHGPLILSGGTTGPEGSALVLPVLLCTIAAILFTAPHSPKVLPEARPDHSVCREAI